MKRTSTAFLLGILLLLAGAAVYAEEDPISRYLFPPEKILGRSEEIGLDEAQRKAIRNEVHKAQAKFLDLQFDLQGETEKMARLLQEKPVDEGKILSQVDRMLALEKEIKKTHISLLVRIKNLLSLAQQAKLSEVAKTSAQ